MCGVPSCFHRFSFWLASRFGVVGLSTAPGQDGFYAPQNSKTITPENSQKLREGFGERPKCEIVAKLMGILGFPHQTLFPVKSTCEGFSFRERPKALYRTDPGSKSLIKTIAKSNIKNLKRYDPRSPERDWTISESTSYTFNRFNEILSRLGLGL